jgi:hypothetical protein
MAVIRKGQKKLLWFVSEQSWDTFQATMPEVI